MTDLVHGAYYWLRSTFVPDDLYIGQFVRQTELNGVVHEFFEVCGDMGAYEPPLFEVLEMIEYKGNK